MGGPVTWAARVRENRGFPGAYPTYRPPEPKQPETFCLRLFGLFFGAGKGAIGRQRRNPLRPRPPVPTSARADAPIPHAGQFFFAVEEAAEVTETV